MKHLKRGFTLIELMIIIAIVLILAAVAVTAYQDYGVKKRCASVGANELACEELKIKKLESSTKCVGGYLFSLSDVQIRNSSGGGISCYN